MLESFVSEWKRMLEEKMILLAVVLLPLAVNLLLGVEFAGEQILGVPTAVIDEDNSSLSRAVVQQFGENETFDIKYYPESYEAMEKLLKTSRARMGIIIPRDFSEDIKLLKAPNILLLYDGSQMAMVGAAKSSASEILLTLKAGASIKWVQGKLDTPGEAAEKTVIPVGLAARILYNPAKSYKYFLNPGIGAAIVQSGIALMCAVAVRREELAPAVRRQLEYILGKIFFYTLLGTLSLLLAIAVQTVVFHIPFRGNIGYTFLMSLLLALSVSSFAVTVSVWVQDRMVATLIAAVLFIPNTVMVGYTWPVLGMPQAYRFIARLFPFYHYADPIRDMYLKGLPISQVLGEAFWFFKFTVVLLFAAGLGLMRIGGRLPAKDAHTVGEVKADADAHAFQG